MKNQINYNPDVLSCLANLSNDEVFTPPGLANQILDLLPNDLWQNKDAKFLDPVSKSGVFLREIARRLITGLEKEIPDKQGRIDHICQNQIYGIAITELTSLLSRRSIYCSKSAMGKYSVCDNFNNEQGNIIYDSTKHTWAGNRCQFCNVNKSEYDRSDLLETHAYQFIHTDEPVKIFNNMKFDVIIGNPPYQLSDGSGNGAGAVPIYQKFVQQAKKLNPRYLTMIIPSRWYSGGRGLDDFRNEMLKDKHLTKIIDYFDSNECFPGVDISGGVNYFLWERESQKDCEITTIRKDSRSVLVRPLLETDSSSFIRFNEAISIFRKIIDKKEVGFFQSISSARPFGLRTFFEGKKKASFVDDISVYTNKGVSFINRKSVLQNESWINTYKVFVSYAYGERGSFPYLVIGKPFIGEPGTICSETYLVVGPFDSLDECKNTISYMKTRFFRFLVLLKKNTQHATRNAYSFVPTQDFQESWTDEKLYKKYGINKDEIDFIESLIRPME